jgi:hypothetical protein
VSAMGRAVEVFRQNAIERDALLIERAETAHDLSAYSGRRPRIGRIRLDLIGDTLNEVAMLLFFPSGICQ